MVSLEAFQVVFVHLVYTSALFLASWCCSSLLHVAVNLICVSLVSLQPVLLSTLPEFSHSFCGQTMCVSRCSSEKFHLDWCQSLFIPLSGVPNYFEKSFSPTISIWVYRNVSPYIHNSFLLGKVLIILIINIKNWTLWSVPSPELQLLSPTFLWSISCSPSLWSVVIWFQWDSV
jgi:hypothetical protein